MQNSELAQFLNICMFSLIQVPHIIHAVLVKLR